MIKSERIEKLLNTLLIVFMFTSVDTVLFGTNRNQLFLYIPRVMAVIGILSLPILSYGSLGNVKINIRDLMPLLTFLLFMTVSSLIYHESIVTYISRILTILLGYTICQYVCNKVFFKAFDRAMIIISIGALIMELIAYLIPSLLVRFPKVYNTADTLHYTFFFSSMNQRINAGSSLIRASGIFWEPGAFAIYLIFALFIQLFVMEKTSIKTVVLYLVALTLTFSTTGYVTISVLLLAYIFSYRGSALSKRLKALFITIIVVVLFIIISEENSELFIKVFGKLTSGTSSASTRYSSIFNGIKVILDHPLIGVASQSQSYMAEYVDTIGNQFSNGGYIISNTVISYTVSYGIVFGLLFLIGHYKFIKQYTNSIFETVMIFITFSLAYSGERLFSFFPFIFVFYGLKRKESDHENTSD